MPNGPRRWHRVSADEPFERRLPLDRGFRWRAEARGFQGESGDERDFSLVERGPLRTDRILDLGLQRGWAERFRAVRAADRRPRAGVEIVLDGRSAGKTGEDGMLTVRLSEKPRTVEARYKDWRLADRIDLAPPWRRRDPTCVAVVLAPAPVKPVRK